MNSDGLTVMDPPVDLHPLVENLTPELAEAFWNLPAAASPHGIFPNFDNPPSISNLGNALAGSWLAIGTLAFFMRMFTRIQLVHEFKLEDYLFIFAYCHFIAIASIMFVLSANGLYHQWDMRVRNIPFYLYNLRILLILYYVAMCLIKTVIVLQYLNIFTVKGRRDWFYWSCHVLIWCNGVFYLVAVLLETFSCRPVDLAWDVLYWGSPTGQCIDILKARLVINSINLISHLIVLILPQKVIWSLKISRTKRKLGISSVFAIGIFACTCTALRLYFLTVWYKRNKEQIGIGEFMGQRVPLTPTSDQARMGTNMGMIMPVEVTFTILAASLTVAPKFYNFVLTSNKHKILRLRSYLSKSGSNFSEYSGSSMKDSRRNNPTVKSSYRKPSLYASEDSTADGYVESPELEFGTSQSLRREIEMAIDEASHLDEGRGRYIRTPEVTHVDTSQHLR